MKLPAMLITAFGLLCALCRLAAAQQEPPTETAGVWFVDLSVELTSLEPGRRAAAARRAGELGRADYSVVQALCALLGDETVVRLGTGGPTSPALESARALQSLADVRALEALQATLRSADVRVRRWAVRALDALDDSRAASPLATCLADPDLRVQALAAEALDALGLRALPPLLNALQSPSNEVRERAAVVLEGFSELLPPDQLLVDLTKTDPRLRAAAATALGIVGAPAAREPLIAALKDPCDEVRAAAARSLQRFAGPEVLEPLLSAIDDPSAAVRLGAAKALGEIDDFRAVAALLGAGDRSDPYGNAPYSHILEGREKTLRHLLAAIETEHGGRAIDLLRSFKLSVTIGPLTEILRSKPPGARLGAVRALSMFRDARVLSPLISALEDPSLAVRLTAARALGGLRDRKSVVPLIATLDRKGEDPAMLAAAIDALGLIGDRSAVDPLLGFLGRDPAVLRGYAARALARFNDRRAAEGLEAARWLPPPGFRLKGRTPEELPIVLEHQGPSPVVGRAPPRITAPVSTEASETVRTLADRLSSENATERARAARALGRLGSRSAPAVPRLIELLDDSTAFPPNLFGGTTASPGYEAARALGRIRGPKAMEALRDRLLGPLRVPACEAHARTRTALRPPEAPDDLVALIDGLPKDLSYLGEPAVPSLVRAVQLHLTSDKESAARALGAVGDLRGVDALLELLIEGSAGVRNAAATALGAIGDSTAGPELAAAVAASNPYAAEALGRLGGPEAFVALSAVLSAPNADLRAAAATALGKLGNRDIVPSLIALLVDEGPGVCEAAASALGVLGDPRAIPALASLLAGPRPPPEASQALARLGPGAVGPLVSLLENRGSCPPAASALGALRSSDALAALVTGLGQFDQDCIRPALRDFGSTAVPSVRQVLVSGTAAQRRASVQALQATEAAEAVPAIIEALQDRDIQTVEVAGRALSALTGRDRCADPVHWRAWWAANQATWRPSSYEPAASERPQARCDAGTGGAPPWVSGGSVRCEELIRAAQRWSGLPLLILPLEREGIPTGMRVLDVSEGSPFAALGIRAGDVLRRAGDDWDNALARAAQDWRNGFPTSGSLALQSKEPGAVWVELDREGQRLVLACAADKLSAFPRSSRAPAAMDRRLSQLELDVVLADGEHDDGVTVMAVRPGSGASRYLGLRDGDVIVVAGTSRVRTIRELDAALGPRDSGGLAVLVLRGGRLVYLPRPGGPVEVTLKVEPGGSELTLPLGPEATGDRGVDIPGRRLCVFRWTGRRAPEEAWTRLGEVRIVSAEGDRVRGEVLSGDVTSGQVVSSCGPGSPCGQHTACAPYLLGEALPSPPAESSAAPQAATAPRGLADAFAEGPPSLPRPTQTASIEDIDGEDVVLRAGTRAGVKAGSMLRVVRIAEELDRSGALLEVIGEVEVTTVEADRSRARSVKGTVTVGNLVLLPLE